MRVLVLHSDIAPDAPPEEQDTLIAAQAVTEALAHKGHTVTQAPFREANLDSALADADIVFNLVESVDGQGALAPLVPRLLAQRGVRFTGVPADAMALTNDKPATKARLRAASLVTPDWSTAPDWAGLDARRWIVKSALEDASLGLDDACVVNGRDTVIARAADCAARFGGDWFAEAFVEGREFNISLLQDGAGVTVLPMAEIVFADWPAEKPRIVGYDAKWAESSLDYSHTIRAFGVEQTEPGLAAYVDSVHGSLATVRVDGFARVDLRVTQTGTPMILEINTNPCISPDAGFAAAAEQAGMDYGSLVEAILLAAM